MNDNQFLNLSFDEWYIGKGGLAFNDIIDWFVSEVNHSNTNKKMKSDKKLNSR